VVLGLDEDDCTFLGGNSDVACRSLYAAASSRVLGFFFWRGLAGTRYVHKKALGLTNGPKLKI
jgi:hypothetical protein